MDFTPTVLPKWNIQHHPQCCVSATHYQQQLPRQQFSKAVPHKQKICSSYSIRGGCHSIDTLNSQKGASVAYNDIPRNSSLRITVNSSLIVIKTNESYYWDIWIEICFVCISIAVSRLKHFLCAIKI